MVTRADLVKEYIENRVKINGKLDIFQLGILTPSFNRASIKDQLAFYHDRTEIEAYINAGSDKKYEAINKFRSSYIENRATEITGIVISAAIAALIILMIIPTVIFPVVTLGWMIAGGIIAGYLLIGCAYHSYLQTQYPEKRPALAEGAVLPDHVKLYVEKKAELEQKTKATSAAEINPSTTPNNHAPQNQPTPPVQTPVSALLAIGTNPYIPD